MDDIDWDIRKAQIGKKDEVLVNPYKPKEVNNSKPYLMPPQNVNYHKYQRLNAPYPQSARSEDSTKSRLGWWIIGLLFIVVIGTKIMGMW
jgi:hypothetical protein